MTQLSFSSPAHWAQRLVLGAVLLALAACSALRPTSTQAPVYYSLDAQTRLAAPPGQGLVTTSLPTLILNPPHAAAGFDSQRIVYLRQDHQLAYFARSEWVDTPARMLGPLLLSALDQTGAFASVVLTPASVEAQLRLDTQIIRLQQNFQSQPSRVQFGLRVYLTDEKTRRVLAWNEFNAEVPAASETAQGGVQAANMAVAGVLAQLAQFVTSSAHRTPQRLEPAGQGRVESH
jgi:cholesterol transport system auxiliary component